MNTIQRFETKFDKVNGCWEWKGWKAGGTGYGMFDEIIDGKHYKRRAHRFSYELYVVPIPKGLDIDHLCKNRICVNPDHLEPVTRRENLMRGETNVAAINANKTKCPRGHDYNEENTYRYANGDRRCRVCGREDKLKDWNENKDKYNKARREKYQRIR